MSLRGNVRTMPLSDLLLFLANRDATGTLELSRGNAWKRLYLEKGRIISSGSSDPRDWLGHFLIAENKITEEQLTRAMEVQEKTKVMLGKILVMIGAVSEEELLTMLETKCEESLFSMFLWEDAEFEFYDQQLPAVRLIPTSMDIQPMVRVGLERLEEWKQLRQMYPSAEIRFQKNPAFLPDPVLPDTFSQKVYELSDGKNTIGDIVMQTHAMDYKVLRTLHELKKKNLMYVISYGELEAPVPGSETIPLTQILDMGKQKLIFGKWEEAINLFQYALHHEENQETRELLNQAEHGLVQAIYEEIISSQAIPHLLLSPEALARERLSSEESFLLARMNGRWDLKSILNITPLREVDALRIVRRLIDRKIVGVM